MSERHIPFPENRTLHLRRLQDQAAALREEMVLLSEHYRSGGAMDYDTFVQRKAEIIFALNAFATEIDRLTRNPPPSEDAKADVSGA